MKLIAVVSAFIGIFFFNSGIAQVSQDILGRLHFGAGTGLDKFEKVFDSNNKVVCYIATYDLFGKAIDCLKGNGDKTALTESGRFFAGGSRITKVFDPEENIMCYAVSGSLNMPGSYGSVMTFSMDCEKI